jgi:hypothetical protein
MTKYQSLILAITSAVVAFGLGWWSGRAEPSVPSELYRSTTAALGVEFTGVAAELRKALLQRDLLERTARTAIVLQKLGPESAEQVLEVFETIWMDIGQTELVLLADWWARSDPKAAMEWAESDLRTATTTIPFAVLRSWARLDPLGAIDRASKGRRSDPKERRAYMAAAIEGWEDSDQPGVVNYIRGLGAGLDRQQSIRGFTRRKLLREGIDNAFHWADALDDDDQLFKLNVIRRVATDAARIDPAAASIWAKKYEGTYYMRSLPQRIAIHWARQDPLATMAWLESLEPGKNRDEGVREGFRNWARRDYDAAIEWLTRDEHQAWMDEALALYARREQLRDPEKGLELASKIVNDDFRASTEMIIARTWADRDEEAARQWVEEGADLTEKQKQRALYTADMRRRAILAAEEKTKKLDEDGAQERIDDMSDPDAEVGDNAESREPAD